MEVALVASVSESFVPEMELVLSVSEAPVLEEVLEVSIPDLTVFKEFFEFPVSEIHAFETVLESVFETVLEVPVSDAPEFEVILEVSGPDTAWKVRVLERLSELPVSDYKFLVHSGQGVSVTLLIFAPTLVSSLGVATRVETVSILVARLPVSNESSEISELRILIDSLKAELSGEYEVLHPQEFVSRNWLRKKAI